MKRRNSDETHKSWGPMRAFLSSWTISLESGSLALSSVCCTRVNERLRVEFPAANAVCVVGRVEGLAGGGGSERVSMYVVRELYEF